jgi:hypothetical protein
MLQALQNAHPMRGQSRNAQQQQRGRQQMGALQDMVRRESGLLDRAEQRGGQMGNPNSPTGTMPQMPQNQAQAQGQPSGDPKQRDADARTQNALRRALGELMQQFGDLTGKVPPSLGEADQAMQQSMQSLGQGQDQPAAAAQKKAIEALSKGGQEMAQQMAQQFGVQPGDQDGQDGQDGAQVGSMDQNGDGGRNAEPGDPGRAGNRQQGQRDPLGRLTGEGNSGADEGNDVRIPEGMEHARTRAIEEELRRRDGERTRPQQELDYIGRLLKTY